MKKVIESGNMEKEYNFKCERCGCEFVVILPEDDFKYIDDVSKIGFFNKKILKEKWEITHCPECRNRCSNYYREIKKQK